MAGLRAFPSDSLISHVHVRKAISAQLCDCATQFGAEINTPWFGEEGREQMFAPWRHAEVVCLYPSVFDLRSAPAGQDNRSTVMMQHFVAYVRGANGLAGVAAM
jgi:hypothetical protein